MLKLSSLLAARRAAAAESAAAAADGPDTVPSMAGDLEPPGAALPTPSPPPSPPPTPPRREPVSAEALADTRWLRLRSSGPAPALAEHSMGWALDLPRELRPTQLLIGYPRVANRLALVWRDLKLTDSVFDSLAKSTRSNRRGFPAPVAEELRALHELHLKRKVAARRPGAPAAGPAATTPAPSSGKGPGANDAWSSQATSDR